MVATHALVVAALFVTLKVSPWRTIILYNVVFFNALAIFLTASIQFLIPGTANGTRLDTSSSYRDEPSTR